MFDNMFDNMWTCVNADENNRELIKRHWPCPHLHHVHSSESERSSSRRRDTTQHHRHRHPSEQHQQAKKKVMCDLPLSKTTNRYHHQHHHPEQEYSNKIKKLNSHDGNSTTQDTTNKVHYVNANSPETLKEEIQDGDYVINSDERHSLRVTLRLNYNTKQHCSKEITNKLCSSKSKNIWKSSTRDNKGHNGKGTSLVKENQLNNVKTKNDIVIHSNHKTNTNEKGCSSSGHDQHNRTSLATPLLAALLSEYESYNRQVKLKALQELLHKQHDGTSSPSQSAVWATDRDTQKLIRQHELEVKSNELRKTTLTEMNNSHETHLSELVNEPFSPGAKSITNTERQTSLFSIKGGISSEEEVLSMNTAGLTCTPLTMFHEVPVVYCDHALHDKMSVHWQGSPIPSELENNTNINKINTSTSIQSTSTSMANNKYDSDNFNRSTTPIVTTASPSSLLLLPPRPFVVPPSQPAFTQLQEEQLMKKQYLEQQEKVNIRPFPPQGNVNSIHCGPSHLEHNKNNMNSSSVHPFHYQENCRGENTYEHVRSKSTSTPEWSSSQNTIYTSTNSCNPNNSHASIGVKLEMNGNTMSNDTQVTTPFSTLLSPLVVHENKYTSALLKPLLTATVTHSSHNLFGVDNYHVTLTTSMLNEYIERKQKEVKEKEQQIQQQQRENDIMLTHTEKITHNKRQLHEEHNILRKQEEHEHEHHHNNNSKINNNYTECTDLINTTPPEHSIVDKLQNKEAHDANIMAERWIHSHHLSYSFPEMLEEISSCSSTTQSSSRTRAYSIQAIASPTESLSYVTEHYENNHSYNTKEQVIVKKNTTCNMHEQVHTHAVQTKTFLPSKTIEPNNTTKVNQVNCKSTCPSLISTSTHVSTPPLTSCIKSTTGFHPFCVYEDHADLTLSEKYNVNTFNYNRTKSSNTSNLSKLYERNKQEDMERVKWNIDKDAEVLEALSISTCSSCAYGAGLRGMREYATLTQMYNSDLEEEQQQHKEHKNMKMNENHLSKLERRQYENKCARIWANQHAVRAYSHHMEHHHDQCQLLNKKNNNANHEEISYTSNRKFHKDDNNKYEVPAEEIWNCPACTRADKAVIFFRATRHVASSNPNSNNNIKNSENYKSQEQNNYNKQQNECQQRIQSKENSNATDKSKDNNRTIYNNMKRELINSRRMRIYEWLSEVRKERH